MLALVGLLGMLFAGVVADAAIGMATEPDEDDTPPDSPEEQESGPGSVIDWATESDSVAGPGADEPVESGTISPQAALATEAVAMSGGAADDILNGDDRNDTILGADGNDLLGGRGGNDVLAGGPGDDQARGGGGDDLLDGGAGTDVLHGDGGKDTLSGGAGADTLFGHDGDDLLLGGMGDDEVSGGEGEDILAGGDGADSVTGGWGDDVLHGGEGADTLDGGAGDDLIFGARDGTADFLNGGEGDDLLLAGAGDIATGGEGGDSFALTGWSDGETPARIEDFDASTDQIVVVYDPDQHPDPELTFHLTEDGRGTVVLLDGIAVAEVPGITDLSEEAVRLTTEMPLAA